MCDLSLIRLQISERNKVHIAKNKARAAALLAPLNASKRTSELCQHLKQTLSLSHDSLRKK